MRFRKLRIAFSATCLNACVLLIVSWVRSRMLAVAFNGQAFPTSNEQMWMQTMLVAFGGMLVGYGFAFPFKYPPHQYILAMMGMLAATSWQSGSSFGLLVYIGLSALLCCAWAIANRRAKRKVNQNNPPSPH